MNFARLRGAAVCGVLGLPAVAIASPCASPVPASEIASSLDAAEGLIATSPADARARLSSARFDLLCLDEVAAPDLLARFAQDQAAVAWALGDSDAAVSWGLAADQAFRGYPWPAAWSDDHALRQAILAAPQPIPVTADGKGFSVDKGGAAFVDGAPIAEPSAPAGVPVLLQLTDRDAHVVRAEWIRGEMPADVLGKPGAISTPGWYRPQDRSAALDAAKTRLAGPPPAQKACDAVDSSGFKTRVDSGIAAVFDDDAVAFGKVWRELRDDVPCLSQPVSAVDAGRLLYATAVVEHAVGQDWRAPLQSALAADPALDRSYGPAEIKTWVPPAPAADREVIAIPADSEIWLDGNRVTEAPDPVGLHVAQRKVGDRYESIVLRSEYLPADWAPRPTLPYEPSPETRGDVRWRVAVGGGIGLDGQRTSDPSDYVPEGNGTAGRLSVNVSGDVRIAGPAGVAWDLASTVTGDVDMYAGAAIGRGPLRLLVMGGGSTIAIDTAGDQTTQKSVGMPAVGVSYRRPMGPVALDLGGTVGGTWQGAMLHARAGVKGGRTLGWTAGVSTYSLRGFFVQDGNEGFGATASRDRFEVFVGLAR